MREIIGRRDAVPDDVSGPESIGPTATASAQAAEQGRETSHILLPGRNFPTSLGEGIELFMSSDGHAYIYRVYDKRLPVLRVGTKPCDAFLR